MADDPIAQLKVCTKCGVSKAFTTDYFKPYRRGLEIRFSHSCRLCNGGQEGDDRPRPQKRSALYPPPPSEIKCRTCGETKCAKTDFRKDRRSCKVCQSKYESAHKKSLDKETVRAKLREYRKKNPDKVAVWERKNAEKHRARGSEYLKRKYARLDKAKARRDGKRWRELNPEKARIFNQQHYLKNKERYSEKAAQRYAKNPEAFKVRGAIRRAREFGSEGAYTKDDIRELLKKHGRVCFYCGEALKKFHADHFIPLIKGGSNSIENIRLSCPGCNLSKHARLPWEWKPDRFSPPNHLKEFNNGEIGFGDSDRTP